MEGTEVNFKFCFLERMLGTYFSVFVILGLHLETHELEAYEQECIKPDISLFAL